MFLFLFNANIWSGLVGGRWLVVGGRWKVVGAVGGANL